MLIVTASCPLVVHPRGSAVGSVSGTAVGAVGVLAFGGGGVVAAGAFCLASARISVGAIECGCVAVNKVVEPSNASGASAREGLELGAVQSLNFFPVCRFGGGCKRRTNHRRQRGPKDKYNTGELQYADLVVDEPESYTRGLLTMVCALVVANVCVAKFVERRRAIQRRQQATRAWRREIYTQTY